jgi:lipid-A-disaccharide synthase
MAAVGCDLVEDLTLHAVMGVLPALAGVPKFWALLSQAEDFFRRERPDAVILIDYPGFNWNVARLAKKHDIPVFYYGGPQMWAWGGWRVEKMRRYVDHVLCKLPFEENWYRERGVAAQYIGHPYYDQLTRQPLDEAFLASERNRPGRLVTLLPGSRTQEIKNNLPWLLRAAERIHAATPDVRFSVAAYNERFANRARELLGQSKISADVHVGKTQELIHLAECCLATSGSVSLELLWHEKPSVIVYKINLLWQLLQRGFLQIRYVTLVNLLASAEVNPANRTLFHPDQPDAAYVPMPEYVRMRDPSEAMAAHVIGWLHDPQEMARYRGMLRAIKNRVGHAGASKKAAEIIAGILRKPKAAKYAA